MCERHVISERNAQKDREGRERGRGGGKWVAGDRQTR